MNSIIQKSVLATIVIGGIVGGGIYGVRQLTSTTQEAQAAITQVAEYQKYGDYLAATKTFLSGEAKLMTAKLSQDTTLVQHLEKKLLGVSSKAAVQLNLHVEYAFGYDLSSKAYDIAKVEDGIEIRVGKPMPVATPSVRLVSTEVLSGGVMIDEKTEIIQLMTQIQPLFDAEAKSLSGSAAVKALCEKQLIAIATDFMKKQGVKYIPSMSVVYR